MSEKVRVEDVLDPNAVGGLCIVFNELRDRINTVLDKALEGADEEALELREHFYQQLLRLFDEKGYIPDDIEIVKTS